MGYQIFEKQITRTTTPAITITKIGRIMLNAAAARIFHENAVESVLLLLDREQEKIALRPINKKDARAYRVTYGKNNNGCSFSGKSFLDFAKFDYSKKRSFPATWNENDGLMEVALSTEKEARQRRLLPVEPHKRSVKIG
jgi:hypothetical protein